MYRLQTAGEYFVGVFGHNVNSSAPLPFTIGVTVEQNRYSTQVRRRVIQWEH